MEKMSMNLSNEDANGIFDELLNTSWVLSDKPLSENYKIKKKIV